MAGITIAPKPLSELILLYEQDLTAFRAETRTIHEQYFAATKREAQAGAQLVNWPEGAGIGIAEDVDALVAQGQRVAQQAGIYLAMPTFKLFAGEERPAENRLFVIDPTGKVIIDHIKYGGNFLEGTLLGNGVLQIVATPFGLLSGVICWDADFVTNMRQAGQQGVDLIVIGANDWPGINAVHAQMAVFRAIENGTTILRQASNGTSLAVDPYGRVLSSFDHFTTTDRVLIAQMPVNAHVFTLYTVIGDAFGWLTVVGFMVVSVWAVMKGRKAGRTPSLAVEQPVTV
jgi:apolipoprotein N-acyltransferase